MEAKTSQIFTDYPLRALLKAEIKTTSGLRVFYSQNPSWLCPENPDEVNKVAQSMERKNNLLTGRRKRRNLHLQQI